MISKNPWFLALMVMAAGISSSEAARLTFEARVRGVGTPPQMVRISGTTAYQKTFLCSPWAEAFTYDCTVVLDSVVAILTDLDFSVYGSTKTTQDVEVQFSLVCPRNGKYVDVFPVPLYAARKSDQATLVVQGHFRIPNFCD